MGRIIVRTGLVIVASIAVAAFSGPPATAGQTGAAPAPPPQGAGPDDSDSNAAKLARAREKLADLFISEQIDRIDFQAESFDQGMALIYAAVDAILMQYPADSQDITTFADHAGQVIGALNSHRPRGLLTTFGQDVDRLPVRNHGEARMLGELVAKTVSLIHDQYGTGQVAYYEISNKLFRSVILDVEQGPFLTQYLDGIQLIIDQPPEKRARYFR